MNCICLVFILLFFGTVGIFITNFISVVEINNNTLELIKLTLKSELATTEVLALHNTNILAQIFQNPVLPTYQ